MLCETKALLTVPELAARLRYSHWYVRFLARNGRIPCIRLSPGGHLRFDPDAVEAALHGLTPAVPAEG